MTKYDTAEGYFVIEDGYLSVKIPDSLIARFINELETIPRWIRGVLYGVLIFMALLGAYGFLSFGISRTIELLSFSFLLASPVAVIGLLLIVVVQIIIGVQLVRAYGIGPFSASTTPKRVPLDDISQVSRTTHVNRTWVLMVQYNKRGGTETGSLVLTFNRWMKDERERAKDAFVKHGFDIEEG